MEINSSEDVEKAQKKYHCDDFLHLFQTAISF